MPTRVPRSRRAGRGPLRCPGGVHRVRRGGLAAVLAGALVPSLARLRPTRLCLARALAPGRAWPHLCPGLGGRQGGPEPERAAGEEGGTSSRPGHAPHRPLQDPPRSPTPEHSGQDVTRAGGGLLERDPLPAGVPKAGSAHLDSPSPVHPPQHLGVGYKEPNKVVTRPNFLNKPVY